MGQKPLDPTNFKAWKRKIDNCLVLKDFNKAQKSIKKAETCAESLAEKSMVTNFYRELAKASGN